MTVWVRDCEWPGFLLRIWDRPGSPPSAGCSARDRQRFRMLLARIYEDWVRRSIELGQASAATGGSVGIVVADVPVGALVIDSGGQVLAEAVNRREAYNDPTAHAEVLALRAASRLSGSWRLTGMTLVVSLEPCPMCAGAAVNARVARIVFGAWNPAYGACGSVWDLPRDRRLHHRPEVVGGVLAEEAGELVSDFFTERRR